MKEPPKAFFRTVEDGTFDLTFQDDLLIVELALQCIKTYPEDTFLESLKALMNQLEDEHAAKVLVLKGFGNKCLEVNDIPDSDYFRRSERVFSQLSRLPIPTIFVLNDDCSYFNLQLALSCDFRIGLDNCSFQCPEIKQGLLPGMLTFSLSKYVGLGVARRVILGGIPLSAEDAYRLGLLDFVCSLENLETTYMEFALSLASTDRTAFKMGRRLINESFMDAYEAALGKLLAAQNKCLNNLD